MSELLMWVLGGFWRFVGFIIILGTLVKGVLGLVAIILNRDIEL